MADQQHQFEVSGNLVLAAFGWGAQRGVLVLDREGAQLRSVGPRIPEVGLAGFEDSLLGGSLSAFDGGSSYARRIPVETTMMDPALAIGTTFRGDKSWTTEPADVVERTSRGVGLTGTATVTPSRW